MISIRTQLAGLALAGMATVAQAGIPVTITGVSDYDFRGVTQTAGDPALSFSFDYYTGPVHLGAWTSNIQWDPTETGMKFFGADHTEVDLAADYSGGDDATGKYNFGFVDYTYPGQSFGDFPEIWGTLSKGWLSGTLHYSWDWAGVSALGQSSAYYIEANATWPLGGSGFGLTAHAGHSWGDYWDNFATGAYEDYAVGLTKSFGNFNFALKYIDTNGYFDGPGQDQRPFLGSPNPDVFSGKGKALLSISTTVPWAKAE